MKELRTRIAQVAGTPETVLITGESGTGKELVARALHAASDRAAAPLVSLNCPVLSAQLMESELFGHERGAFTGADNPRTGRFELADGGTILLDEISEIDLSLQAKLLRVLQEKSFERVGSSRTITVDVRMLATSNRDLHAEIAAGRFREDLYYRLAVVPLELPPLRERRGDIPELLTHFLRRSAQRLQSEAVCVGAHRSRFVVPIRLARQRSRAGKHRFQGKRAQRWWNDHRRCASRLAHSAAVACDGSVLRAQPAMAKSSHLGSASKPWNADSSKQRSIISTAIALKPPKRWALGCERCQEN